MKVLVYTRYDKTGKFYNPIQCANTDDASKFIEDNRRACIRLKDPAQKAYIADLTIFQIGFFDDTTAKFDLLPEPLKLCECSEWLGGDSNG